MAIPNLTGDMLSVGYVGLAQADLNAIKKRVQNGCVHGLYMTEARSTNSSSPCVEDTMTNTPMHSRTTLKTRPGAVLHPHIAGMNDSSVGRAKYFVMFIDEASAHISAFEMKTKSKSARVTEATYALGRAAA